ncbi:hypothetical protein PT286_07575 [Neisseriaceae bacterium ESL0693]|nr:hypothetical protein [Neisseriaceae bacterium ESL0693]
MDDLTVRMGLDTAGFVAGRNSAEQKTIKSMRMLDNAYKSAAKSEKGLTDAKIAQCAQSLSNIRCFRSLKKHRASKRRLSSLNKLLILRKVLLIF